MAEFYTVSNSMRAKDREGNPKVWHSDYGDFDVWNLYFQGDDVKYQVNKKEGFEGFTKGQSIYGTKSQGKFGGQFKQEQAPDGEYAPAQNAPASQSKADAQPATGGDLEAKIDYLTTLIENFLESNGGTKSKTADYSPTDIDDRPVDISALDI